jgi:3-isopropylmalate/(R)-2-methylmalate dehydratase small subunit
MAGDADREALAAAIAANPDLEVTVDVENLQVVFGDQSIPCEIKAGARESLLNGTYDPLDELLEGAAEVTKVTEALAYMQA